MKKSQYFDHYKLIIYSSKLVTINKIHAIIFCSNQQIESLVLSMRYQFVIIFSMNGPL